MRAAFTLIELLVVITIIGLVSAAVIAGVVWALGDQQLLASAQLLQGALVGARDAAIAANAPCGIRLLPSSANPDSLDRIMPLVTGPRYMEGLITTDPAPTDLLGHRVPGPLTVEESPITWVQSGPAWVAQSNSPTSWAWNVRLGDRISWGGRPYTVCGPNGRDNTDLFVHDNTVSRTYTALDGVTQVGPFMVEFLLLANGVDDDMNGFIDDGWDGVDNNRDIQGQIDEADEWEIETWTGPAVSNIPYVLTRRPIPGNPQSTVSLSIGVDLSASTLLVNPLSGTVDLMIRPDGTVDLSGPYAAPSAVGLGQAKSVFVLQDPSPIPGQPQQNVNQRTITLWTKTGRIESD